MKSPHPSPCTCPEGAQAAKLEEAKQRAKAEAEREEEIQQAKQSRIDKLIKRSGMGARSLNQSFETFKTLTANTKSLASGAELYVENFSNMLPKRGMPLPGCNGIIIIGDKGTGKTHITSAIANELLKKEIGVICMTERGLLGRIRQTYSERDMSEKEVLDAYIKVPLLIIDDLGKEKASEWTLATLYSIIDGRYEEAMPIIVTTNYDEDGIVARLTPTGGDTTTAECIVDRLKEVCRIAKTKGTSWREGGGVR